GEQLGLLGIRRRPGIVGLLPLLVAPHEALLVRGEVSADLIADEEVLVRGKAETGARGVCEFGTAFAMALRRTRDFRDSLRDGGLREDQLRATGGRPLGFVDRLLDRDKVVPVRQRDHIPPDRLEARRGVLALRL